MKKLTMKAYAVKHKLSVFNVIKMLKSGKLKSISEEENGREITYILLGDELEKEVQKNTVPLEKAEGLTVKEEIQQLREELSKVKNELESLRKAIL